MGKTEYIARWVEKVRYEDIPPRVVDKVRDQFLNVVAAIHAGFTTTPGKIILKTIRQWGGDGEATIIPTGDKSSLHSAVLANSSLAMALDYVDYLLAGHTGVSAVVVSLALAEKVGAGGKELITAQIIGNEVAGRIGASVAIGPHNGQAWSYIHLIGAACITARLLGLSAPEIQNAIGISMYQPNYVLMRGFMGPHSKLLTSGSPAMNGVIAAQLAQNGFTGAGDILEHPLGFCQNFADVPLLGMISGLGKSWVSDTLCYKIYPGCAYIDAVMDCVFKILKENPSRIIPEEIDRVIVSSNITSSIMDELSRPFTSMEHIQRDDSPIALNFSIPWNVAVGIIDGELTPAQLAADRILDPRVHELARRVKPEPGRGVSINFLRSFLGIGKFPTMEDLLEGRFDLGKLNLEKVRVFFSAKVSIKLKDGKIYSASQDIPFGAAGREREETRVLVRRKFKQEVGRLCRSKKIARVIEMVDHIEDMEDITPLVSNLCGAG